MTTRCFTLWTTSDDPRERDALTAVVEAAGLARDSQGYGYGSATGHEVTIGVSWAELIETLGTEPLTVAMALKNLVSQLWTVSEASWGDLTAIDLIDYERIIWLRFNRPGLDLPVGEWERLVSTSPVELQCDGPEASTVIAHQPGRGWGRVDRASCA